MRVVTVGRHRNGRVKIWPDPSEWAHNRRDFRVLLMKRSKKVIVTNSSALQRRHGLENLAGIPNRAVGRLVKRTAKRGIETQLIAIDRATDIKSFGQPFPRGKYARQVKRAIDRIFGVLHPDYIMILGAPDGWCLT